LNNRIAGSVATDIISPLVHPKVQRYYRTDIRLCQDTSYYWITE